LVRGEFHDRYQRQPNFRPNRRHAHYLCNAKGLPTLKKGGPLPYPDGTVFADDVHEFSVKDGSYVEGTKKAVTVMVKDAKKYPSTGGWGFQVWAGGDPSKPLLPDVAHSIPACFTCHTPQKSQDYTFSTYIP
jgi:Cytochrome P460